MSLDTYTQNIPLTQKARYGILKCGCLRKHVFVNKMKDYFVITYQKSSQTVNCRFWSNYVAALKGKNPNYFLPVFICTHPSLPVRAP